MLISGRLCTEEIPVINEWYRGQVFSQYSKEVTTWGQRLNRPDRYSLEEIVRSMKFFSYTMEPNMDPGFAFFIVAASTSIESVSTLNRFSHPLEERRTLLLPTVPGIFIPEEPESDLELLIAAARTDQGFPVVVNGSNFYFIPGHEGAAKFSSTEYAFFLDTHDDFSFPLKQYRLTSPFGPRVNPVTGVFGAHNGLDLAAPTGTDVFATRKGEVIETGTSAVFGDYIRIQHSDNWTSLYGHLSKIETTKGEQVKAGELIGRVGSTGQSTGPHLHFELRQNGRALDPRTILKQK
ncbi:peptidase M23 [Spirochaetia bacterium]|nr:peptidase M23 [Spirochaetia bacterium]GHU30581.1 peptidase M23 [Spirochaetia bacterium]